jgi:endonuclease/exonuclease/phosphatase family metal-dependent hydrolase
MLSGLLWGGGLLLLLAGFFLAFLTLSDFRPEKVIRLEVEANRGAILKKNVPLSLLTFNIGYGGLDAGADFFMDGGKASRAVSLERTRVNLEAITRFLSAAKADLVMLQEVDVRSSRSYRVDEAAYLKKNLAGYGVMFAVNYKVPWVPVPITRPMGAALSGLLTFSRFQVRSAARHGLPGHEAWPRRLAELDRCLIECRLPVTGGKELVLLNLHLSVFDPGGRIRKMQLAYLQQRIAAEYDLSNHVIAGGDWNHGLPGTDPALFKWTIAQPFWYMPLPDDFTPPGFSWAVDKTVPTIRSTGSAYKAGENFVAVIDGFLASPNVEIRKVSGHDLAFRHSDHNPVSMVFVLK